MTIKEILNGEMDQAEREKLLLDKSVEMLNNAKDDTLQTADAVNSIVAALITLDDTKQEVMAEFLGKVTPVNKTLIRNQIKKAKAAKKQTDRLNGEFEDSISIIEQVEIFINRNYEIKFNQISNQFEMLELEGDNKWKKLNENNIYRNLKKRQLNYSISDLVSLLKSDYIEHYNPIIQYFENLPAWDGIDYISKLSKYITVNVNDIDRFGRMFRKMFIRSVACSLEQSFNKQAFMFIHEKQNSGKTTFIRWLCPPDLKDYYTENINTDKDSLIALTENFIINLDELSTLSKVELNALKSVMSKDRIKVRLPYDRTTTVIQRRCNFWGSTNRDGFLNDETGSVRWVCFNIDDINWDYNKDIDINKVWAQAYHLLKTATNEDVYQLTPAEIHENEKANAQFIIRTEEMEYIVRFFLPATAENYDQFLTASDIKESLQKKINVTTKFSKVQIGKSMALLGFKREQKYSKEEGYAIKGYYIKHNYDDYTESKTVAVSPNEDGQTVLEDGQKEIPY